MKALSITDTSVMISTYEQIKLKWHWKFLAIITTLSTLYSIIVTIKNKSFDMSNWKFSIILYGLCTLYFIYYRYLMNNPNALKFVGTRVLWSQV